MPAARVAVALAVLGAPLGVGDATRSVTLTMRPAGAFAAAPVVGDLSDGDVLRLQVQQGEPGSATVSQCTRREDEFIACTNGYPVLFDDDGVAIFQYQIRDTGGCGPSGACAVVVERPGSDRRAYVATVFGALAPVPPTVMLEPGGPYEPGASVEVRVDGAPAGASVSVAFCSGLCDEAITTPAGADGTATATIAIGDRCRRCGVRVVAGASEVITAVSFTTPPRPIHSPRRLALGLGLATALLALAALLIARSEWRPPSEAATPDLDAADLATTGADE